MMEGILLSLFLICFAYGDEPKIVFDNRPETGVPREALAQMRAESNLKGAESKELHAKLTARVRQLVAKKWPLELHDITDGTIKTVRIRYFNKETWETKEQAREYVCGFLAHKSLSVFGFQMWSQVVGVPEIECLIDFTDEYRKELRDAQKPCREGRLLIWETESCFRDATGRWWFVSAFDHFHRAHPKGNRKRAKQAK